MKIGQERPVVLGLLVSQIVKRSVVLEPRHNASTLKLIFC
jgi:hypothetical protein